ncbi:Spectrin beta chain, non-erythrocytic 1 [Frankliniella fusca]|uniref:Spectrin beta chain, non-erythrocytic 1 n=1 Tax=Frankliniella fusca TaxID=407009 RepID=A0AAE1H573_9NEOP|nr:Spectrin beta chain, non-erythrocytic 1 [Frankliniella fusca]
MSVRRRGCSVDADCLRSARCLRRLPPVAEAPRYAPVCRCLHPPAPTEAPAPAPASTATVTDTMTASAVGNLTTSGTTTTTSGSSRGHCVQTRVLGQPCHLDTECSPGMVCSMPDYLCECSAGRQYSPLRARCEVDPGTVRARHRDPWTLDLPPIADMDAEVVETIPATYDCPLLVGMISVVLVLICLVVAAYCRFTDPPPKPPGYRPARTEREEGEPFEWWSETSPLRSSWGGESDLSSLRRVKQCSCDLAQSVQAAARARAQDAAEEPPRPSTTTPRSPRAVLPPRVPTQQQHLPDELSASSSPDSPPPLFTHPLAPLHLLDARLSRTPSTSSRSHHQHVQLPPLPPLEANVRLFLQQVPAAGRATVR